MSLREAAKADVQEDRSSVETLVRYAQTLADDNFALRKKLEAAQGALENISINLEGDLERLPLHILLYKLQMVKAVCDGALRKVEQKELDAQRHQKENELQLRVKLDEARRMFEAIIKTNGEFAIKQSQIGIAKIDAKQEGGELEPMEQESQNAD